IIGIIAGVLLIALPGRDHATPIPFRPAFGGDQLGNPRLAETERSHLLSQAVPSACMRGRHFFRNISTSADGRCLGLAAMLKQSGRQGYTAELFSYVGLPLRAAWLCLRTNS